MKLTKDIIGCADGDVYPRTFAAGEECPPELEEAARELGALKPAAPKADAKAAPVAAAG